MQTSLLTVNLLFLQDKTLLTTNQEGETDNLWLCIKKKYFLNNFKFILFSLQPVTD